MNSLIQAELATISVPDTSHREPPGGTRQWLSPRPEGALQSHRPVVWWWQEEPNKLSLSREGHQKIRERAGEPHRQFQANDAGNQARFVSQRNSIQRY